MVLCMSRWNANPRLRKPSSYRIQMATQQTQQNTEWGSLTARVHSSRLRWSWEYVGGNALGSKSNCTKLKPVAVGGDRNQQSEANSEVWLLSFPVFFWVEADLSCHGCQEPVMQLTKNNSHCSERYRSYRSSKNEVIPSVIYSLSASSSRNTPKMEAGL